MASRVFHVSPPLISAARPTTRALKLISGIQSKRYDAFDASLDKEVLNEARAWFQTFDESNLPKGNTTYARSSGPGGQHVNKTETKATTVYSVKDLLAALPRNLHSSIRSSNYYVANNDSLTFQDQSHRSRSSNADENRQKLVDEIKRLYYATTPAETTSEKKKKYEAIERRFHDSRIKQKKFASAKKQARRGP